MLTVKGSFICALLTTSSITELAKYLLEKREIEYILLGKIGFVMMYLNVILEL